MSKRKTRLSQIGTRGAATTVEASHSDRAPKAVSRFAANLSQPLVLDLDWTLLRADLLFESFAAALKRNPLVVFAALFWLLRGKAYLKRRLAEYAPPATDVLPENQTVAALAQAESAAGRRVVLATAADELMARRIAARFAFIDEVIASDGRVNLKGQAKADAIAAKFPRGFIYAGDCEADLPVWSRASEIVVVEPSRGLMRLVAALEKPALTIEAAGGGGRVLVKALRIKQWIKNGLIFAPIPLAGLALDPRAWASAMAAFLGLCLVASATYLLNDMVDLADDRRHWSKRERPMASGALRLDTAMIWMVGLAGLGLLLAGLGGWRVFALVAFYTATTLAYSFHLKRVPILDVATLAGLFTFRLFLGVVAIGAVISPWLFAFSMALFLSLSIAKRHTEVVRMALHGKTSVAGRGYVARDEPLLLAMGLSAAASAIVLFSLYLMAEAFNARMYSAPAFLWATPMALFLWLGRVWLLSQRGELDDDPVGFAIKDGPSIALGAILAAAFLLATLAGRLM